MIFSALYGRQNICYAIAFCKALVMPGMEQSCDGPDGGPQSPMKFCMKSPWGIGRPADRIDCERAPLSIPGFTDGQSPSLTREAMISNRLQTPDIIPMINSENPRCARIATPDNPEFRASSVLAYASKLIASDNTMDCRSAPVASRPELDDEAAKYDPKAVFSAPLRFGRISAPVSWYVDTGSTWTYGHRSSERQQ